MELTITIGIALFATACLLQIAKTTELRLRRRITSLSERLKDQSSIRIVLSEMSDEMLQSNLSTGPTASVWKGVSECVRRLKDRYADDAAGANSEAKASAMDRMTALDDLLILMDQWYRAKKEGER